ncbi:glycerophosphodiester phosphodiesterase [Microbacterium sp. zg.B48]|uniref:glycerophosphodiester phosphodiesterase family protein n=1 Tax=Microbacterium sp. zg.B48 TaxID=2969408 RepID=UPI00214C1DC1|nr:glycerophosphodiester phosphodiesterase family protein [Microbacterium sp. zg.B48]MCR2762087.1 glycerophosphodiester phosphodiesterase [Microbacterium sp. zg.B48]
MTHGWFAGAARPRVLAHRGLLTAADVADGVVENSFAAIAAAHAAGAEYIESDCHLTADGRVVLFHDADLVRVAGDRRRIADVTSAELDSLLEGRGGMITLEQALDAFPDTRFNLDVKAKDAAVQVGRIVAPYADRVLLASFSDVRRRTALAAATSAAPGTRPATSAGSATIGRVLSALASRSSGLVARALADVDALQVPERYRSWGIVTPRLIAAAHRHHVEVHVWTVNDPRDMRRLVSMGVDGLVTDRADLALEVLQGDNPPPTHP